MKALKLAPLALLALAVTVPADAGHRHRNGCGHVYSRPHRGWVSIDVSSRYGGFSYRSRRSPNGYGRYGDRYGDPYYDLYRRGYSWKDFKRREKYYKKRYRKRRHHGHFDYGPFCPGY